MALGTLRQAGFTFFDSLWKLKTEPRLSVFCCAALLAGAGEGEKPVPGTSVWPRGRRGRWDLWLQSEFALFT